MKMQSLQDLLIHELADLYSAETQHVKALPKMAEAASFSELRNGFEEHLAQTEGQVERLERIFEQLQTRPNKRKKCVGMEGLIEEGEALINSGADAEVLDAGLICGAQKVEHYEIAAYGCARAWAEELGLTDAVQLLDETLEEEKATDQKLTELAEHMVNQRAENAEGADGNGAAPAEGSTKRKARAGR
jgi:ferritin-like metal-binding protein YciE